MPETNETTLEALWNQFHDRLYRFICARISDENDAEDILQEVFLRIHSNLERVREMDRLESWVYQITRNAIIDTYRSRHPEEKLIEHPAKEGSPESDTSESITPYIRQIVQSLPEPYREALLETEYQGISQVELADRLGISISGVKSRVQRARQKVKEIMLACCHYEFDVRGMLCCYRARCPNCEGEQVPISFTAE
jgi:RNA polymerase sigma-70 factor, ECF subfamily